MEQVVDTMLHELCHIVHGPHNQHFHALWDQLRDEHAGLLMKGYTGEGFLSEGRRLGGGASRIPPREARRLALQAAERRQKQPVGTGPGKRLGGIGPRPGDDIRRVIAHAAERRSSTLEGCGTDRLSDVQIHQISETATRNGFRTQAEEDEANEVAIAQALLELVREDEKARLGDAYLPPSSGGVENYDKRTEAEDLNSQAPPIPRTSRDVQDGSSTIWVCGVCTLHNPANFLCCDACGSERPTSTLSTRANADEMSLRSPPLVQETLQSPRRGKGVSKNQPETIDLTTGPDFPPTSPTTSSKVASKVSHATKATSTVDIWQCSFCGQIMERQWWTCSTCGRMKDNSK